MPVDLQKIAWEAKRGRERNRQAENSKSGRDIGDLPPVADPARRDGCEHDLRRYLETYHAAAFPLAWSDDHLGFIEQTQRAIVEGLQKVQAMPRGSGKTTIFERAILWALLYGHRRFAVLVAATDEKAIDNLDSLKGELETNELLLADFPEVCYPIVCLERITNRCRGQTYRGEPTRITLTTDKIVFPTIAGSGASSCVIIAGGITGGRLRGPKHTLPDGTVVRPEIVLVDDPQTRKTAASASECRTRERVITGDILGMAGPGKSVSVLAAVTVIYRGDLADRLLNRTLNPTWRGERCKLVDAMPSEEAMKLWEQYWQLRAEDIRNGGDGSEANRFVADNFDAMHEGSAVAWPERKLPGDLSALHFAMNLYFANREAFQAEYQNEPLDDSTDGGELLTAAEIMARVNKIPHRTVPLEAEYLTAHIDCHDRALYFAVVAWTKDFSGYVVDYGTWPEQPLPYYLLRSCPRTLAQVYPRATKDGAIRKGLEDLTERLCSSDWQKEGEGRVQVDLVLIDEGYKPKIVQRICRRSKHRRVLRPSKGQAIGAKSNPMSEWKDRDGERKGDHWRLTPIEGQSIRRLTFDTNNWKSFVHDRLGAAEGDPSTLTLYGDEPKRHELIADHLSAEYRTQVEGKGRRVDEWDKRPGNPDNHLLDNVVGAAVAAGVLGCKLPDATPAKRRKGETKADANSRNPGVGATKPKRRRPRRGMTYAEN
jgi:hypothetical protein